MLIRVQCGIFCAFFSNSVGQGERCEVKASSPVSPLVVTETDYTYLVYGFGAVATVMVSVLVGIVACRRLNVSKYDFVLTNGGGGGPNGCNGSGGGGLGDDGTGAMMSLYATNNPSAPLSNCVPNANMNNGLPQPQPPPPPPQPNGGSGGILSSAGIRRPGVLRGRNSNKQKGVTIVNGTTTIEAFEEGFEPDGTARIVNAVTRTCELGNVRAPKELWLV